MASSSSSSSSSSAKQQCRKFSLKDILSATSNFSDNYIIGKGGFGKVYRGFIDKRKTMVAVKRLNKTPDEKPTGFEEEIAALTQIRHRNIVSLIGYCNEKGEKILVYEYIANHTLEDHLHNPKLLKDGHSSLSWNDRLSILIGAARGLYHLHYCIRSGSFIHRDVKSSNMLLDENLVAKVSDFGLAKYVSLDHTHSHVTTAVRGTPGYLDPYYYATYGNLTRASDTYSFGVMVFEVLSGRKVVDNTRPEGEGAICFWALEREAPEILDPVLSGKISEGSLKICCNVAKRCLRYLPKERPEMSEVLAQLELAQVKSNEENVDVLPPIVDLAIPLAELQEMTEGFDFVHRINRGSRGTTVYYGHSYKNGWVAIKQHKCHLPEQAFLAQVATLSSLNHENVVKLHGFCMLDDMDFYVYEYASKKSLHDILHGKQNIDKCYNMAGRKLSWAKTIKIAVEVAKGLCYIHDEKELIHRNIKSSNVLIVDDGTAKITDLHLSNPCSCNLPDPIRGRRPACELYHPPEFSKDGDSKGGDVYSFGILLLELLTCKEPIDPTLPEGRDLVSWATPQLISEGGVQKILDPRLGNDYPLEAVEKMAAVAVWCLANEPIARPTMNEVLIDLQEALGETQNYYQNLEQ